MSRHLQHRLHTQLRTVTERLDLPLTEQHLERLAVEMTAPVKAMLTEALAGAEEEAPLPVIVAASACGTGIPETLAAVVAQQGALPVPVGRKPVPLSGPICSQSEARAAGLDVAPSVEELDGMAECIVHVGDPLSAEVSLAQAVPLLGAAVTRLRAQAAALLEERRSTNEALDDAVQALRADRPADTSVPCTELSRWVRIADALNAAHAAGMPVGIDLDGTLTDHRAWSVVWDRGAGRWTVAGYEASPTVVPTAGHPW